MNILRKKLTNTLFKKDFEKIGRSYDILNIGINYSNEGHANKNIRTFK